MGGREGRGDGRSGREFVGRGGIIGAWGRAGTLTRSKAAGSEISFLTSHSLASPAGAAVDSCLVGKEIE